MFLLAAVAAAPACSKKDDDAKAPTSTAKATDKPAAPAKSSTIDALKLAYDGAAGEVADMSMGGDPNWMVTAPGLVFSVEAPKEVPTLAAAVDDAKMYDPTISKQDKTADGYDLEYNNSGSMGANYFVEILRTIDGKPYLCKTTVDTAEHAASVVKACQSLRAQ